MKQETRNQIIGITALIGAMLCASFLGVFSKMLSCNPVSVQFLRALFGTLSLGVLFSFSHGRSFLVRPTRHQLKAIAIYALMIMWSSTFYMLSFRYTTMGNAVLLHYLTPFIALIAGFLFLKERFKKWYIILVAAGLGGIAFGAEDLSFALTGKNLAGNGAAIFSAFGFAGVIVVTRYTRRLQLPVATILFYTWLTILAVITPLTIIWGDNPFSGLDTLWGFLLGLVSTALTYLLLNFGMRHISAGRASIINFSEVIFNILLGLIIFDQQPGPRLIIGCVVLFICICIIAVQKEEVLEHEM